MAFNPTQSTQHLRVAHTRQREISDLKDQGTSTPVSSHAHPPRHGQPTAGARGPSAEMVYANEQKSSGDLACTAGAIYKWTGSSWVLQPQADCASHAFHWLKENCPERANAHLAKECVASSKLNLSPIPCSERGTFIPLSGKWLRIDADGGIEVVSPIREAGLTYQLGFELTAPDGAYQVQSLDPTTAFAQFLETSLPDAEVRGLVQEYVGYTLMGSCAYQTAQVWVGGGNNGKSVLTKIVQALHYKAVAMRLDRLDDFNLFQIVGASLVVVAEMPRRGIDEQQLKLLIAGDAVQVEAKFKDPFTYWPTAKWIVCSNHYPNTKDHSDGWWRRWHLIDWTEQIPEEKIIPDLHLHIINTELKSVLDWALAGLQRLLQRGSFHIPKSVADAKHQLRLNGNSVAAWADEFDAKPSIDKFSSKRDLHKHYVDYCENEGKTPCGDSEFFQRIQNRFGKLNTYRPHLQQETRPRYIALVVSADPKRVGTVLLNGDSATDLESPF